MRCCRRSTSAMSDGLPQRWLALMRSIAADARPAVLRQPDARRIRDAAPYQGASDSHKTRSAGKVSAPCGVINLNAMTHPADNSRLSPEQLAELSALADGTLDPERRAEVEPDRGLARVEALYERERRVVELVHEARSTDRAPRGAAGADRGFPPKAAGACAPAGGVRRRVCRRAGRGGARARAGPPGGSPGAPSVSQAAGLAMLGPRVRHRCRSRPRPSKLETRIERLYFPNWARDSIGPRSGSAPTASTVARRSPSTTTAAAKEIAYTIVDAPALSRPDGRYDDAKRCRVPHAEAGRPHSSSRGGMRGTRACCRRTGRLGARAAELAAWEA